MRKTIAAITAIAICCLILAASADETAVYVTASELNGRSEANIKASIEARFMRDECLEVVGYQIGWVEAVGGETGTVFCKAEYLTEYEIDAKYANTSGGRVFIHKELGDDDTDVNLIVDAGKSVTITRVLHGYGYMGRGWVEMRFFEREDEAE